MAVICNDKHFWWRRLLTITDYFEPSDRPLVEEALDRYRGTPVEKIRKFYMQFTRRLPDLRKLRGTRGTMPPLEPELIDLFDRARSIGRALRTTDDSQGRHELYKEAAQVLLESTKELALIRALVDLMLFLGLSETVRHAFDTFLTYINAWAPEPADEKIVTMAHMYNELYPPDPQQESLRVERFIRAVRTNSFKTAYFLFVLMTVYGSGDVEWELMTKVREQLPVFTDQQIQFLESLDDEAGGSYFFEDEEEWE